MMVIKYSSLKVAWPLKNSGWKTIYFPFETAPWRKNIVSLLQGGPSPKMASSSRGVFRMEIPIWTLIISRESFRYLKWRYCTLYLIKLFQGVGIPLHRPHILHIEVSTSMYLKLKSKHITLLGTDISFSQGMIESMIFLFPFGGICTCSLEGIHTYILGCSPFLNAPLPLAS